MFKSTGKKRSHILPGLLLLSTFLSADIVVGQIHAQDVNSHRVSDVVNVAGNDVTVKFYTAFKDASITVINNTAHRIRYSSYEGYVAIVAPYDTFDLPCDGNEVSGQIDFPMAHGPIEVFELPFCGDIVEVIAGGRVNG